MKSIKVKCHPTEKSCYALMARNTVAPMTLAAIKNPADSKLYEFDQAVHLARPSQQVMPDDHSKVVPLLPIPNRTVKRLCADDSAGSRVKVGHRQALTQPPKPPRAPQHLGVWAL